MDVFLSWLKENFPTRISVPLGLLIAIPIGTLQFPLENYISDALQNQLSKIPNIRLIATLFLSISYLLLYRSHKNKKQNYTFDKRAGIYFHKKSKEAFCPSCLASDIEAPLRESAAYWQCMRKECVLKFPNPDYQAPPQPPRRRSTWSVTDWQR